MSPDFPLGCLLPSPGVPNMCPSDTSLTSHSRHELLPCAALIKPQVSEQLKVSDASLSTYLSLFLPLLFPLHRHETPAAFQGTLELERQVERRCSLCCYPAVSVEIHNWSRCGDHVTWSVQPLMRHLYQGPHIQGWRNTEEEGAERM